MRRSVGLLFIIGLLGSRCRTDKSLVDCHARDPRRVTGGLIYAAIYLRIARQSRWLPACDALSPKHPSLDQSSAFEASSKAALR